MVFYVGSKVWLLASCYGSRRQRKDGIWLYNPRKKKGRSVKLMRPWEGPYVVIKRLNDLVYRIQRGRNGKLRVVHRNRLWAYRGDQSELWNSETDS